MTNFVHIRVATDSRREVAGGQGVDGGGAGDGQGQYDAAPS